VDADQQTGTRRVGPATDRADLVARLADQMQEITAQSKPTPARLGDGLAMGSTEKPAKAPRSVSKTTAGNSVSAVDAPGHPEDAPGDPEAVAKAICLRLLTGAARPRAGLAAALARKGIPNDVAERVLDRLTEVGLIDDEAYAQSFVVTRHRHGGLGAGALREELRRKGVDARTADSAVSVVDRDAEYRRARALLEKRVDSAMAHGVETARRRLLGLLARRGYPADVAQRVVQEVIGEYDAEVGSSWS
jgi:regulatory protein